MLNSYNLVEDGNEHGLLYAVIYLVDGTSFGQYVKPGTQVEVDEQVLEAVKRYTAPAEASPVLATSRTAADVTADLQVQ